jgi:hypothetical protein
MWNSALLNLSCTKSSKYVICPIPCYLSLFCFLSYWLHIFSSCSSVWWVSENNRQKNWLWILEVVYFINKNRSWFSEGVCVQLYLFILSVCLCIFVSVYLSPYTSLYLSIRHLPTCPSIFLLLITISLCLSSFLSIWSVCLSTFLQPNFLTHSWFVSFPWWHENFYVIWLWR